MKSYSIAVIGTGYVGLVSGTCFAHVGHRVICCDVDATKIERLKRCEIPIYEPGLDKLVAEGMQQGRLSFTTDIAAAIQTADVIFIAVGTPMSQTGEANLDYVQQAARMIGTVINGYKVIVTKSTVPVGTGRLIAQWIGESAHNQYSFDIVSNPEFLREGSAVYDCLNMERTVIGADRPEAAAIIAELHEPFGTVVLKTSIESAELIKYASNCFLAMKISYINSIANLCDQLGADVDEVAQGMGLDSRIGHRFLQAGIGYGGSCFPKDTYALRHLTQEAGCSFSILEAVIDTNEKQRLIVIDKLQQSLGTLAGKRIAVLGLAFKPNTNDVRDAPSLTIIPKLLEAGAIVRAYDPIAAEEARHVLGDQVVYMPTVQDTVMYCDACLILTEWEQIVEADWEKLHGSMSRPLVIDGRNCWSAEKMAELGYEYISMGRPFVPQRETSLRVPV
ncbi:UDP-glucose dehydrogenase family protein, partial [Paenibacillus assamensis]|uniref:UDP-glucose dehydrogenase family protein n=1 Tax=Paenibacillus assamensis TaxID=311244 RepID=UPI0003FDB38B